MQRLFDSAESHDEEDIAAALNQLKEEDSEFYDLMVAAARQVAEGRRNGADGADDETYWAKESGDFEADGHPMLILELQGLFPRLIDHWAEFEEELSETNKQILDLHNPLAEIIEHIKEFLERQSLREVRYLGPLRTIPPRLLFETTPSSSIETGAESQRLRQRKDSRTSKSVDWGRWS